MRTSLIIGSANPDMAEFALRAPTAECRCVVVDESGIAIYIADITHRGDVV
jgi:GntR family transcriptional regulator